MQAETTQPLLITIKETMQRLRLGRSKVYALIRQEGLPVQKFGRRTLVEPCELERWLVERRAQG